jgi:hypothetical protein
MNFKALALITITAAAIAAPAFAHHSFAMFDSDKTVTLNGTVKEFEWTNPHSWIRINVADANGTERQWAIEMGSPAQIAGRGWKSDTIKPGDKIGLTIHPLKDGSRGGQFMSASLPDGKTLANAGARYNALGN